MTNLQTRSHILIEYLISNGYHRSTIEGVRRCIRLALELGTEYEIRCYKDIFEAAVNKLQFKPCEARYNSLKSTFGMVEDFDINGGYPNTRPKGFNKPQDPVEKLNTRFKEVALKHEKIGFQGKNGIKRSKTVHVEFRAAVQFLLHLQSRGKLSFEEIQPQDIYTFFFDGTNQIRGQDYCRLVKAFLSHIQGDEKEYAQKIIDFLPKIPKNGRLYYGLTMEEGNKILCCLEDMSNNLSMRERAVGLLAYFYGIRGTDISKLTFDNIDWRKNQIVIIQSKTQNPLPLPLEPIVGNAIFNYMKNVRMDQNNESRVLFLKKGGSEPPLDLKNVISNVFREAGVRIEEGIKGFRPMRHYFATTLLSLGEKCEVVAKLLGHSDLKTLDKYADLDYNELRKYALSISQFPINPEVFKI